MTFFMHRLADALAADGSERAPMPAMRPSSAESFTRGSDRHVALRSYAEQLVSEANAVIADPADHLRLADEVGGDALVFTIACRDHVARVETRFADGVATGVISSPDLPDETPHELVGPEAVPDLLIRLCLVAGVHNPDSAHLV